MTVYWFVYESLLCLLAFRMPFDSTFPFLKESGVAGGKNKIDNIRTFAIREAYRIVSAFGRCWLGGTCSDEPLLLA